MTRVVFPETDESAIDTAAQVLASGGLVVFPTDTVYGVGAAIDRPDAVERLYVAKGRPLDRAIPVLVSGEAAVERLAFDIDDAARLLMRHFWPGPLTIVVPAAEWLPKEIVRDTGSVGVRMPDHPVAQQVILRSGGALATTSANRSGEPESCDATDAERQIGDRVDLIVDGGGTPGGVPSTVVRVEPDGTWTILRDGAIPPESIRALLELATDKPD